MRICKRGHKLKPENTYVSPNGERTCKTCKQASARKYRQRNPEKVKAYNRAYRQRNLEKRKAYDRKYRQRNRITIPFSYTARYRAELSPGLACR